jgi:hypothetical protein
MRWTVFAKVDDVRSFRLRSPRSLIPPSSNALDSYKWAQAGSSNFWPRMTFVNCCGETKGSEKDSISEGERERRKGREVKRGKEREGRT